MSMAFKSHHKWKRIYCCSLLEKKNRRSLLDLGYGVKMPSDGCGFWFCQYFHRSHEPLSDGERLTAESSPIGRHTW